MATQSQDNPDQSSDAKPPKDLSESFNPQDTYKLERAGFVEMVQNLLQGMASIYASDPEMRKAIQVLISRIQKTSSLTEMMSLKTEVMEAGQKTTAHIQKLLDENHSLHERYHSLEARFFDFRSKVVVDEVTETLSKDVFDNKLDQMIQQFKQDPHPLFLALITIDGFSATKKKLSARETSNFLSSTASRIKTGVRDSDPIYRYNEHQFTALFQHVPYKTAPIIGERICKKVCAAPVSLTKDTPSDGTAQVKTTVSVGFAQFKEGDNAKTFFQRARTAADRAHNNGGDQMALS